MTRRVQLALASSAPVTADGDSCAAGQRYWLVIPSVRLIDFFWWRDTRWRSCIRRFQGRALVSLPHPSFFRQLHTTHVDEYGLLEERRSLQTFHRHVGGGPGDGNRKGEGEFGEISGSYRYVYCVTIFVIVRKAYTHFRINISINLNDLGWDNSDCIFSAGFVP